VSDQKYINLESLSAETVIRTIKQWESEARNFRNDGWVQEGYRERLRKVFTETGKALSEIKNIN
tara:strand:- start:40 stop:231 length:192 start_codon:yes stop_codon:yes gene_type:complete